MASSSRALLSMFPLQNLFGQVVDELYAYLFVGQVAVTLCAGAGLALLFYRPRSTPMQAAGQDGGGNRELDERRLVAIESAVKRLCDNAGDRHRNDDANEERLQAVEKQARELLMRTKIGVDARRIDAIESAIKRLKDNTEDHGSERTSTPTMRTPDSRDSRMQTPERELRLRGNTPTVVAIEARFLRLEGILAAEQARGGPQADTERRLLALESYARDAARSGNWGLDAQKTLDERRLQTLEKQVMELVMRGGGGSRNALDAQALVAVEGRIERLERLGEEGRGFFSKYEEMAPKLQALEELVHRMIALLEETMARARNPAAAAAVVPGDWERTPVKPVSSFRFQPPNVDEDEIRGWDLMTRMKLQRSEGYGPHSCPLTYLGPGFWPAGECAEKTKYLGFLAEFGTGYDYDAEHYIYVRLMSWPDGLGEDAFVFDSENPGLEIGKFNLQSRVLCEGGFMARNGNGMILRVPVAGTFFWVKWCVCKGKFSKDQCLAHVQKDNAGRFPPSSDGHTWRYYEQKGRHRMERFSSSSNCVITMTMTITGGHSLAEGKPVNCTDFC